ncbi:MAG: rod shape-determining protein RodA [Bacteroidales bacterium]|nr:rod shape-determining protein RodA [Bacteroidales bacterium]
MWIYSVILLTGAVSAYFFVKSRKIWVKGLLLLALFAGAIYLADYYFLHRLSTGRVLILAIILAGLPYIWYIFRFREKKILVIYLFVVGGMVYVNLVDYAFNNFLKPHQKERIEILLRVKDDPKGAGYNINQSVISIGSGGFSGKGYLRGTQTKFRFVPAQSTDFIFCTIGEEWGFAGSFVVIGLYVFLLLRLIFLAERQKSSFSRIYGYGVVSVFLIHFFINIGMASGIVPVIGIPLPFISYGGSSLWGFTLLLFIFLRLDAARTEYLV